jgi:hypothetical protein
VLTYPLIADVEEAADVRLVVITLKGDGEAGTRLRGAWLLLARGVWLAARLGLQQLGISPGFYAAYNISLELIMVLGFLVVGLPPNIGLTSRATTQGRPYESRLSHSPTFSFLGLSFRILF